MSIVNQSRNYVLASQNMSEVKEMIGEYSMNFEEESVRKEHSIRPQQISEMIQSGSHTHTRIINSISQGQPPKKVKEKPGPSTNYPTDYHSRQSQLISQPIIEQTEKPIFLGANVFKTIKERYNEVNRITTQDPQVLYDFYCFQKKTFNGKNLKNLQQTLEKIGQMMPSMQRKMLVKLEFQKMLKYKPNDVYYSLCCTAESNIKDRQLDDKVSILNMVIKQHSDKQNVSVEAMVRRLYGEAVKREHQQDLKEKRTKFGRNLSEHFQNDYRAYPENVETVDKLHRYWEGIYERQQYGIQWDQDMAREAIRQYMLDQVSELFTHSNKKLGFKCLKIQTLYKFRKENPQIEGVYIPKYSLQEYVKVYNDEMQRLQKMHKEKIKKQARKSVLKDKKTEVKNFGRPVSATPLTILSKPKSGNNIDELAGKFAKDKLITMLAHQQHKRRPRYPFEYGVFNMEDEIKIKQRIKPTPKENYDQTIMKTLIKTFGIGTLQNFHAKDRLKSVFEQDDLESDQNWKNLGPVLKEAMMVKAFEEEWFRDAILRFSDKSLTKSMKMKDNNTIIIAIIKHLNQAGQHERKELLSKLENIIDASQSIAERTERLKEMSGKGNHSLNMREQQKSCITALEEKAKEFVEFRKKQEFGEDFTLRGYLNKLYADLMKEHKEFIKLHYNVVEGQKQCPKLLKYTFFRLVKEINQFQMQKDQNAKSHVWVPSKRCPQSFNYKTFNQYAEAYTKTQNKILAEPQIKKFANSIWGRSKGKQRQKLLMTYSDAKECTFQPKVSRKK